MCQVKIQDVEKLALLILLWYTDNAIAGRCAAFAMQLQTSTGRYCVVMVDFKRKKQKLRFLLEKTAAQTVGAIMKKLGVKAVGRNARRDPIVSLRLGVVALRCFTRQDPRTWGLYRLSRQHWLKDNVKLLDMDLLILVRGSRACVRTCTSTAVHDTAMTHDSPDRKHWFCARERIFWALKSSRLVWVLRCVLTRLELYARAM
jgi:hypothetical protein